MDNFDVTKYFKKQYITEALNLDKYKKITDQYQKELSSKPLFFEVTGQNT